MRRTAPGTRTAATAIILASICLLPARATGFTAGDAAPDGAQSPPAAAGLMNRIDFGNAYVMGQTIKSGAVYLLNRKQSQIRSMLAIREDYRREICEDAEVLDPAQRR